MTFGDFSFQTWHLNFKVHGLWSEKDKRCYQGSSEIFQHTVLALSLDLRLLHTRVEKGSIWGASSCCRPRTHQQSPNQGIHSFIHRIEKRQWSRPVIIIIISFIQTQIRINNILLPTPRIHSPPWWSGLHPQLTQGRTRCIPMNLRPRTMAILLDDIGSLLIDLRFGWAWN